MPGEDAPTPQTQAPAEAGEPKKDATSRVEELERLMRGMEKYAARLQGDIAELRTENRELTVLNDKLRDPKNVEELERLAFTDELTGVYNRRGFERRANSAVTHQRERLRDLQRPESERRGGVKNQEVLSLVMLDIDHFKRVNDTFGHGTGDAVLRKIGEELRKSIRGDDFPGRWGGEEFVLCISSPNESSSRQVAQRLRKAISEIEIIVEGTSVPLSASFGIADWKEGDTVEDTVHRADEALYVAKRAGRDQVVTEVIEEGSIFYQVGQSDELVPKGEITEFLQKKAEK